MANIFLRSMESRDLENAEAMMAPGAKITFPGGKVFSSQREMVMGSRGRYQWVKKTFDRIDVQKAGNAEVVYVMGTLSGANISGVPFSDVCYIDQYVVENGLITQQDVWNDLAESVVLDKRESK